MNDFIINILFLIIYPSLQCESIFNSIVESAIKHQNNYTKIKRYF